MTTYELGWEGETHCICVCLVGLVISVVAIVARERSCSIDEEVYGDEEEEGAV
jgi:hypothetical protein